MRREGGPAGESRGDGGGGRYKANMVASVAGVSRSMLYYYEKVGIVAPERDEQTNYRMYSNEDVFRMFSCDMLRNIGFSLKDVQPMLDGGSFDASGFAEICARYNDRERAWHEACAEAIGHMESLVAADPQEVRLEAVPPWLMYLNRCERGFDNYDSETFPGELFRRLPVASLGFVIGDDYASEGASPRWGVAVPERWAHLFPEPAIAGRHDCRLGGCLCAVTPYVVPTGSVPAFSERDEVWSRVTSFLETGQLRQAGTAFAVNAFPVLGTFFMELCFPVEPIGVRGRRFVRAARRRAGCR